MYIINKEKIDINGKRIIVKMIFYALKLLKTFWSVRNRQSVCSVKIASENYIKNHVFGNLDLNSIFLIPYKVALRLFFSSGSWIHVNIFSTKNPRLYFKRWIRVIIDYDLAEADTCFASYQLYMNIKRRLNCGSFLLKFHACDLGLDVYSIVRLCFLVGLQKTVKRNLQKCIDFKSPNYAKEVKLAVDNNSAKVFSDTLGKVLQNHFSTPKYIEIGDCIAISICNDFVSNIDEENNVSYSSIQFVVISIDSRSELEPNSGCLVSNEFTYLYLDESEKEARLCHHYLIDNSSGLPPCLSHLLTDIYKIFSLFHPNETSSDRPYINGGSIARNLSRKFLPSSSNLSCHLILTGPNGSGIRRIIYYLSRITSFNIKTINCLYVIGDTSAATEVRVNNFIETVSDYTIVVFENFSRLSKDKDGNVDPRVISAFEKQLRKCLCKRENIFVIATDESRKNISGDLWSLFLYQLTVPCPSFEDRKATLFWIFDTLFPKSLRRDNSSCLSNYIDLASRRTTGFYWNELEDLSFKIARHFQERQISSEGDALLGDYIESDFLKALDEIQVSRSDSLNLPSIPSVHWDEIGGLEEAKRELMDAIQLPFKFPKMIFKDSKRSGILLYGPPGTGKTLLAKAVASECGFNFLSVKGPELIDMYIGQSEQNVREVFQKARLASPCIVFFDELDSLAPKRGRSGDSGGVMDRLVSSLLTELDRTTISDVFVLGATNRPDLLDSSLLRPGRFERQIYIGPSESLNEKIKLLETVIEKIPIRANVSMERVSKMLPPILTGADFLALATNSFYTALRRLITDIESGCLREKDASVEVSEEDLMQSALSLKPSISNSDIKLYAKMKEGRTISHIVT